MSLNYSDQTHHVSAQQGRFRVNSGRAPGPDRYAAMQKMFGRPQVDRTHHYGDNVNYTNHDLFDLYKGRNLFLRDTLEGYILQNIEWPTAVLPWLETADHHIKFNTFIFQNTLATPVPNEGISRLITSSSRTFEDSVERYGIAFIMEGDLLGTPEGAEQYRRNIAGIAQCCQETVNYHTLVALLTCKDYYREMQHLHNRHHRKQQMIHRREADRFAILALNAEGFDLMIEEEKSRIRDNRGVADTLIVFPKFPFHSMMVQQGAITRYYQLGPEGRMRFMEGPESMATYRQMNVFQTRHYTVHDNGEHAQPLVQDTTVGEYYPMVFGAHRGKVGLNFQIDHRSLYIYDFTIDDWTKMTFIEVLQQCRAWGPNGLLAPSVDSLMNKTNAYLAKHWSAEMNDKYGRPDTMDLLFRGESNPSRPYFAMLATDAAAGRVFKAETIGQMDVDVYSTSDLVDSANTAVGSMFKHNAESWLRMAIQFSNLISEWEREAGDEAYWKELSDINIKRSVDSNGKEAFDVVGHGKNKTIQWAGNMYGGLDLPDAGNLKNRLPAGMANWPGLQTYVEQAVDKGWADDEKGKGNLVKAGQAVEFVRDVANKLHEIVMHSEGMRAHAIPDWFSSQDVAEAATFELLHTSRIPLFLILPAKGDIPNKGVAPPKPTKWAKRKHAVALGADNIAHAWPMSRAVVKVFEALETRDNSNMGLKDKFGDFYTKFLKAAAHEKSDIDAFEMVRDAFDVQLFLTMETLLDQGDASANAVRAFAKWAEAHVNFKHENNKDMDENDPNAFLERTKRLTIDLGKETPGFARKSKSLYRKLNAGQKAEDREVSAALLTAFMLVDLSEAFPAAGAEAMRAAATALKSVLDLPSGLTEGVTIAGELRAQNEQLAKLARRYSSIVDHNMVHTDQDQWGRNLLSSGRIGNKKDLTAIGVAIGAKKKATDQLNNALKANEKLLSEHFAFSGEKNEQIVENDLKKARVYVRAPLTSNPEIIKFIAKFQDDLCPILLADEVSGFRTPIYQLAGSSVKEMLGHEMMRAHTAAGFRDGGSSFRLSGVGISLAELPTVTAADLGADTWRLGGNFLSEARLPHERMSNASAEMDIDEFEDSAHRYNVHRAALGYGPRGYVDEYQQAIHRNTTAERDRERLAHLTRDQRARYLPEPAPHRGFSGASRIGPRLVNPAQAVRFQHEYGAYGVEQNVGRQTHRPLAAFAGSQGLSAFKATTSARLNNMNRGHFPYRWKMAQKVANPLVRAIMKAILLLPNTRPAWVMLAEKNVNPPCNLVIHRPWIQFRMFTCVILQSGYDTGFNAIGASNMALSSSAGDKMLIGNFTFHHATMIINEKFVSHLRDVYPEGVIAGWGTRPFDARDQIFHQSDRPDWISTFHPITENHFPEFMSLIDTTSLPMYPSATNKGRRTHLPHHSAAAFVEEEWAFDAGKLDWAVDNHRYHRKHRMINVREARGPRLIHNAATGAFDLRKEGSGHLSGNRTGPKAAAVWLGHNGSLFLEQTMNPRGYF